MQELSSYFIRMLNYISTIGFWDAVDILIVAYLFYKVIDLVRKTSSYNLAKGILFLLIAMFLSGVAHLTMINYILKKTVEIGLIALVIIFQPELRKLLAKMGSQNLYGIFSPKLRAESEVEAAITQTVLACDQMSKTKTGALIIRNARIAAAGCVLPLTNKTNLCKDLGMRHRAGIGASEQSDAVIVIVSEETGAISIAVEGMLKRNLNLATFEKLLRNELVREESRKSTASEIFSRFFSKRKVNSDGTEKKN